MTATLPTQYPFPVAPGGLRMAPAFRSLRGPPGAGVRQPDLGQAPRVNTITGFGAGMGAFVRNHGSEADQSQGLIVIRCGLNPGASGNLSLYFPIAPAAGQYWGAADWASLSNPTPVGNLLTMTWNATRTLSSNEVLLLAYQWSVST